MRAQFARVVDQLEGQFPAAAELLTEAEADLLAFATFPVEHGRQIWSNNTQAASIGRCDGAPTWSGSSRTGQPSSALPVPSSPNRTTSGQWHGAT